MWAGVRFWPSTSLYLQLNVWTISKTELTAGWVRWWVMSPEAETFYLDSTEMPESNWKAGGGGRWTRPGRDTCDPWQQRRPRASPSGVREMRVECSTVSDRHLCLQPKAILRGTFRYFSYCQALLFPNWKPWVRTRGFAFTASNTHRSSSLGNRIVSVH